MVESFYESKTKCLTIKIIGRFDYSCHKQFKEAFSQNHKADLYEVDFAEVTYLDSSALGMLLLLRDHANKDVVQVRLININDAVVDILRIANFHRLFEFAE
ncbi:anti-anti-sigma factor [Marinomonas sp. CT5]|uniref:STAS domain-containing protein n=1 Tax=Marinomonas sp. CT5 TaxID=2066133 RepID=UPI001BB00D03|nr:STAS domain-containing protein [Marinomonas sp. CT5]QUX96842.1 anti-anti-sigma factor [Marinomonas sp. CT5]